MVSLEVNLQAEFRVEVGLVLAVGASMFSFPQGQRFSMGRAFVDSSTYLGVENAFTSGVTALEVHVGSNH